MNVFYSIPYSADKDLGRAYNSFASLVTDPNDWICFVDRDTIFTTPDYGHQILNIIKKYPSVSAFTAVTNRIGCYYQKADVDRDSNDMEYHFKRGLQLQKEYNTSCELVRTNRVWSGFFMLIKKSLWTKIGGAPEKNKTNMIGVDNLICHNIHQYNEKIMVMRGVYLYHWYSNHNPDRKDQKRDITHLK